MRRWSLCTATPVETAEAGRILGEVLNKPSLILLSGDLGAGKTCFVQGLARGLGVPEDEAVTSPTFTLMNHYHGRLELYHFDLYRLSGPEELLDLGMEDFLPGAGIAVVEWAERFPAGEPTLSVHFVYSGEDIRELTFKASGKEGEYLLEQLQHNWREREMDHESL